MSVIFSLGWGLRLVTLFDSRPSRSTTGSPSAICVGSGFRGHLVEFGRNILELLVYYLMLNKCKNLKDMKSSCLCVCISSLYDITKDDISCIITCDSGP